MAWWATDFHHGCFFEFLLWNMLIWAKCIFQCSLCDISVNFGLMGSRYLWWSSHCHIFFHFWKSGLVLHNWRYLISIKVYFHLINYFQYPHRFHYHYYKKVNHLYRILLVGSRRWSSFVLMLQILYLIYHFLQCFIDVG